MGKGVVRDTEAGRPGETEGERRDEGSSEAGEISPPRRRQKERQIRGDSETPGERQTERVKQAFSLTTEAEGQAGEKKAGGREERRGQTDRLTGERLPAIDRGP